MDTTKKHSRKNPEETSNFLSLLFFGWTIPVFWKGIKQDLQLADLYDPLRSDESDRLGDLLEREWKKELIKADEQLRLAKEGKKVSANCHPSLLRAITKLFWLPFMLQGLSLLLQATVLHVTQAYLQKWIIFYFYPGETQTTKDQVLLYAGLLIVVTLGIVFITHHTTLRTQQIGMWVRVACCSIIYRKVLRLDQATMNNTAAGQVANLISNDVARFDTVPVFLHHIWIMPIQLTLLGYVMWQSVGIASLVGIGAMMIQTIPIQGYLSHLGAKLRFKIASRTDERVQLMSELISGIQVVKMYAWEEPFELLVSKVRALELKLITYTSYLRGTYQSVMAFSERVTLYLTLITFVFMGNSLSAEITFVLASLFSVLQYTCAICFPQAVILAGESAVSLKRLTGFLLLDEIKRPPKHETFQPNGLTNVDKPTTQIQKTREIGIEIVKVAANWVHGQLPPTLCDVSMTVESQSLCALVGPVGSGKSSLLHLILGELRVGAGRLSLVTGDNDKTRISSQDIRISYASQDPWLFSVSIRENILFGLPYDKTRYQEVIRVCALLKDFEELPQGDLSFVGERGASLSGGQRARVNLARAVYRDAELYLLDDPLSAVDPRVGRHLFKECIKGFLKGKTRILVTHQLQYLRQADTIVVLNRGTIEHQGTYAQLAKSDFHILDPEESPEHERIESTKDNHTEDLECEVATITNENNEESKVSGAEKNEGADVNDEEIASGRMSNQVYWGYFLAGGHKCLLAFLAVIFITGQVAVSGTDYWVTHWTNLETLRVVLEANNSAYASASENNTTKSDQVTYIAESQWNDEFGLLLRDIAIYVYTFCVVGCVLFTILRSMLFFKICMNASRNIHISMFSNLLRAKMWFFNTNPSGRILNRFSKDIGTMDELIPKLILEALQTLAILIGILTVVVIVNNWMIIPSVIMGGIFYVVRIYYLKTAQNVKRLEGITKSPVFSHVSSTLDGLATIRSRGAMVEGMLRTEFDRHQDAHTAAWYLTIGTAAAFGLLIDLISCAFIACVCFSFILMDDGDTSPGYVGFAISQSLMLTGMIQYGVKQSAEVISQMTSIERVLQYTKLPNEGKLVTDNPPSPTWPSKGSLVFRDVCMKYAESKPPVLKNLTLNINPGWKVGIVGRTGAGKSSLISALFRLTGDGLEGEIVLDGIDTKSVGLHELRPRISIIPQEPILFSATLRHNLDPFGQYSDTELWESLREVELGEAVPSLDFYVAGGGANFSVGQRQLICLARAILRNNRLLVLDEATANVDRRTDALIQNTIRRRFADCTVLTIAHRLNTIMDSDRVLVMERGRAVEFGHPHLLLQNLDGHFSQMLRQTGEATARKLAAIADSAYQLCPQFEEGSRDRDISDNQMITFL